MDKKQIKLFGDHIIGMAKILMQDAGPGDTEQSISQTLVQTVGDTFGMWGNDVAELTKYVNSQFE